MKHIVLLKFIPNYYCEDVFKHTQDVFSRIAEKVDAIVYADVYSNCVVRDTNMDLMVEIKLKNKEALESYLNDDLHIAFAKSTENYLALRVSFDYED